MRRLAVLALVAIVATPGCGILQHIPVPDPLPAATPTPAPTDKPAPPSPWCVGEGQCGCSVEQTPGHPQHVCCASWLPGGIALVDSPDQCPTAPSPEPTPTPTLPPVTPTPACGFPAGLPPFEEVSSGPLYREIVREAAQSCLGCDPGTAGCVWPSGPVDAYACVISALQAEGYCAGRYNDDRSGPNAGSDSVAVRAVGAEDWHEWELFNYGGAMGKHASKLSHAGVFRLTTPEPVCLSLSRIVLDVQDGKAKRHINATPQHVGQPECSEFGHLATRDHCPLGMEGSPDRARCERAFGPFTWTVKDARTGATYESWELAPDPDGSDNPPKNPLVIRLEDRFPARVTVCAANGICGEVVTQ